MTIIIKWQFNDQITIFEMQMALPSRPTMYFASYFDIHEIVLRELQMLKIYNDKAATEAADGYNGFEKEQMITKKIKLWKRMLREFTDVKVRGGRYHRVC